MDTNTRKKIGPYLAAAVCGVLVALPAGKGLAADDKPILDLGNDAAISVRVETGYTLYRINLDNTATGFDSDIVYNYGDVTAGATFFYDRFALDGYGRFLVYQDNTSEWTDLNTGQPTSGNVNLDRSEYVITGGYQLTERIGAFLGYRFASTDSSQDLLGSNTTVKFKTHGPTLGLNAGWKPAENHVFNVLGGIGYLFGDLDVNSIVTKVNDSTQGLGVVAGVEYRYLLSNNWDLRLRGDYYYFDFGDVTATNSDKISIQEDTLSARVGLTYTF